MVKSRAVKHDLHAGSFFGPATQYQKAADQLLDSNFTRHTPIYFLYSHAIELAFKAFLRAHGLPIVENHARNHHRLTELFEDCRSNGLKVGHDDRTDFGNVVELLDGANEDQGLRYFNMKGSALPDLKWTREAVGNLMRVIEPCVEASDEEAGIKRGAVVGNIVFGKPVPK